MQTWLHQTSVEKKKKVMHTFEKKSLIEMIKNKQEACVKYLILEFYCPLNIFLTYFHP